MNNDNLNIKTFFYKNNKFEWKLEGHIKSSSNDKCELICFKTFLFDDSIEFIVIMNIPENGRDNAPCYIRLKEVFSKKEIQLKEIAYVKENKVGGEILHFTFDMFGVMDFIVIANIPFEDQITVPVYLKIKPKGER